MPQREFGWVQTPASDYVRPVQRLAVRYRQRSGAWKEAVLIVSLTPEDILPLVGQSLSLLTDPAAVLFAFVTFYDERGGGIETSFKGGKQGQGLGQRNKKRIEGQAMLVLLISLVHNVIVWSRTWLSPVPTSPLHHYSIMRMVRDIFHISGFLVTDASGQVVQLVLNQAAPLAPALVDPLCGLLARTQVTVNLGQT